MKIEFKGNQGDVAIYEVSEFPGSERTKDDMTEKFQVALGELSGHNHFFPEGSSAVDLFKVTDQKFAGLTFIEVKKQTELVHGRILGFKGKEADQDYHFKTLLRPGKYITGIVEETDWITKTIRRVVD